MKLSEVKAHLEGIQQLRFRLPDGSFLPVHFHLTELGWITKTFMDCGGTLREEKVVSFQLWHAEDDDHRLSPRKLLNIINRSMALLGIEDAEVVIEYQMETIGKFGLTLEGSNFQLTTLYTGCLAPETCGIPSQKSRVQLSMLAQKGACEPGSGCC